MRTSPAPACAPKMSSAILFLPHQKYYLLAVVAVTRGRATRMQVPDRQVFLVEPHLVGSKRRIPGWQHRQCLHKGLQARAANGTPVNLLVIDTEGLGSLDASTQHDCSIFALALLVSSFFIYNRFPFRAPYAVMSLWNGLIQEFTWSVLGASVRARWRICR